MAMGKIIFVFLMFCMGSSVYPMRYIPEKYFPAGEAGVAFVRELISAGADVNEAMGSYDSTLLHRAVNERRADVVSELLKNGADVNRANKIGETALINASNKSRSEESIITLLLHAKANVNHVNCHGQTALMKAICWDNLVACELLIKAGADLHYTNGEGKTALFELRCNGDNSKKILKLLLEAHANVNHADRDGKTALCHFVQWPGGLAACKTLIQAGADVNWVANGGSNVLMIAASGRRSYDKEICGLLIEEGANVLHVDNDGETALMRVWRSDQICELLVNKMLIIPGEIQRKLLSIFFWILKRNYPGNYSNLRHVFTPILKAIILENNKNSPKSHVLAEVNKMRRKETKSHLLKKYFCHLQAFWDLTFVEDILTERELYDLAEC